MYYNQFTNKYHMTANERDDFIMTIKSSQRQRDLLDSEQKEIYEKVSDLFDLDTFYHELVSQEDKSEKITIEVETYESIKKALMPFAEIVKETWFEHKDKNQQVARKMVYPIMSIMSVLNTKCGLGVYPSYIEKSDFNN